MKCFEDKQGIEEEDELLEQYLEQFGSPLAGVGRLGRQSYYDLPQVLGKLLARFVPEKNARILDAGAGTGSGGEFLKGLGYTHLYAVDISAEALEQARRKEIYVKLYQMTLGERLSLPDNYFDGIISVGVMGLAPPQSFDELVRVTRRGGHIAFSLGIAHYRRDKFKEKQDRLEQEHKWKLVERTEPFPCPPGYDSSTFCYAFVYQVL